VNPLGITGSRQSITPPVRELVNQKTPIKKKKKKKKSPLPVLSPAVRNTAPAGDQHPKKSYFGSFHQTANRSFLSSRRLHSEREFPWPGLILKSRLCLAGRAFIRFAG